MSQSQWLMRIEGAMDAHFKQEDGTSKPGTDWKVGLKNGDATYTVFVRAYLSADMSPRYRKDLEYQGQTVMGYVNDCLIAGWVPEKGGNLAITITNPAGVPPETQKKPFWKFW